MLDEAQLVFPGFKFGQDDPKRAAKLVDLGVGGFCLYGGRVAQIADFTARLQRRARVPLLFCADYEDGAASHCQGATALSSNMGLAAAGRLDLARLKGEITAREALALGVRWVLAPVVDLAIEPANPIVNIRSFGPDPDEVARFARAYLQGLRRWSVLGCLKHFPGHGRTVRDSHLELPVVKAGRALLAKSDLKPFRSLASRADSIMLGHLAVPALGGGREPFSLSPAARRLLRLRLGFRGLVSTDALDMRAISGDETRTALRALAAGADVLLVPRNPEKLLAGLRAAKKNTAWIFESLARLHRAKAKAGLFQGDPGPCRKLLPVVGGLAHERAARKMAQACLSWNGKPVRLGRRVAYAAIGGTSQGRDFIAELRRMGVLVRAAGGRVREGETLVLASFLRPRAYSGRIGHEAKDLATAKRLLHLAKESVVVAFGSPFVASDFPGESILCAFSANAPAQRAAARALRG